MLVICSSLRLWRLLDDMGGVEVYFLLLPAFAFLLSSLLPRGLTTSLRSSVVSIVYKASCLVKR